MPCFRPSFSTEAAVAGSERLRRGESEIPSRTLAASLSLAPSPITATPLSSSGE